MTSRNVANLIPDPAVSSWCLLSGVCSPTVLLSKFKLYGSAKESCHHSGNTAGWHILLERAGHWSMRDWCIRSRLAWSDGLFFSHNSFLSPKCAMTNLHIVTLSETESYKRLMPPSQLGEGLNSWQLLQKRGDPRVTKGRSVGENERLTMAPHSPATPSETELWSPHANDNLAKQGQLPLSF